MSERLTRLDKAYRNRPYLAAWIRWPDGYWHCRHCHREVGTGHPPECPIAKLDFVAEGKP